MTLSLRLLLIGSGGREHALARALAESPSCAALWATPGNPGIFQYAQAAPVSDTDHIALAAWCVQEHIDCVVIGPDQALADGMADVLRSSGLAVFGPSKAAARIEWSKAYAKELMHRAGIPTAASRTFLKSQGQEALDYLANHALPVVIKADGLALGKGVVVAETHEQAIEAFQSMADGLFKEAGNTIVVEDFLRGEEASVFALCDGQDFLCLAPAQDHKRAFDNDLGKNTGGMGSYAPAAVVDEEVMARVKLSIIRPLLDVMSNDGNPFIGCLFVGLMIDNGQPSVVEFNARFGDPETQSVLSVFDGDFAALCYSAALGKLDPSTVQNVAKGVACTVVLASGGYPDAYERGYDVTGLDDAARYARVYHAGTKVHDGHLLTNGGRVLGLSAIAPTIAEAIELAYKAVDCVHFRDKHYRRDIGRRALQRVEAGGLQS